MEESLFNNGMLMMFIMGICGPIIAKLVMETGTGGKEFIIWIVNWIKRFFGPQVNSVTIEYDETIGKYAVTNKSTETNQNFELINSVLFVISKADIPAQDLKCRLCTGSQNDTPVLRLLGQGQGPEKPKPDPVIQKIPVSKVTYQGFQVQYNKEENSEKGKSNLKRKISLIIKSKKSSNDIYAFIQDCYKQYQLSINEDATAVYEYHQIPNKVHLAFMRYKLNSTVTFDSLFFPTKSRVLSLVKKLEDGRIDKLAFCLHGSPGCGKTSFVKALANLTGKHIMTVKMSYMKNDIEVKDIFNNPSVPQISTDMQTVSTWRQVPINQRIYLLEDLDAETDVCHQRKPLEQGKDEMLPVPPPVLTTDTIDKYEMAMRRLNKKKITLSGILNALDGVVEVKGAIIVITTNHRDKLDSALLRYGRITMDIQMKKMLASDAHQLIRKYYPKYALSFPIKDYSITPATLDAFCKQSDSLGELKVLIRDACDT